MNRSMTIAIAFIGALVGGLVTRYIAPPAVLAQSPGKEIRAERFTLVDAKGRTAGTFVVEQERSVSRAEKSAPGTDAQGPRRILLVDPNGREIWSAGGSAVRPLSEGYR